MWIVVFGNPIDGFSFTGPFPERDDALEHAEGMGGSEGEWWIAELSAPDE